MDYSGATPSDVQVTMARDDKSAWASELASIGLLEPNTSGRDVPWRASDVLVKTAQGWPIAALAWTGPRDNAAVSRDAKAGKLSARLLGEERGDASLCDAFARLTTAGVDPAAAARADLVAIGSGPGERTVGGAGFARAWNAAWKGKVTVVSVFGRAPAERQDRLVRRLDRARQAGLQDSVHRVRGVRQGRRWDVEPGPYPIRGVISSRCRRPGVIGWLMVEGDRPVEPDDARERERDALTAARAWSSFFLGTAGLLAFAPILLVFGNPPAGRSDRLLWGIGYFGVIGLCMAGYAFTLGTIHRARQRLLYFEMEASEQPPFLLLRPFAVLELTQLPTEQKGTGTSGGLTKRSYVPRIAAALERIALVLALGDNHGTADDSADWPLLFLQLEDEAWWRGLRAAAMAARGIVLIPSGTPGVIDELRFLRDESLLTKTIIFMPPTLVGSAILGPHYYANGVGLMWRQVAEQLQAEGFALPAHDSRGLLYIPKPDLSIARSVALDRDISEARINAAIAELVPQLSGPSGAARDLVPMLKPLIVPRAARVLFEGGGRLSR
jgi:hypothetical protein